ncbi:MAG: AbrB/MazE/SpoVT family DNA-binding domain-containing protein [Treponema sp.]|nr:AbrB/MazE/SpoVT family DNA-binding domain-containing protein [Treponema sp.]
MIKKLIQHGNSAALILDKPILDLLNLNLDSTLEITTDGKNLIISPQSDDKKEQDIIASLEKINAKYARTLKRLGE